MKPSATRNANGSASMTLSLPYIKYQDGRQLVWDASSLSAFRQCPTYYKNTRQRSDSGTDHPRTIFGRVYHKCQEARQHAILGGRNGLDASLLSAYQQKSLLDEKLFYQLLLNLTAYDQAYSPDPLTTATLHGEPGIELRIEFPLPLSPDLKAVIRLDSLCYWGDELWIRDHKCVGEKKPLLGQFAASIDGRSILWRFEENFSPDTQISFYLWATRKCLHLPVQGVIIDAIQIFDEPKLPLQRRFLIGRSDDHLAEWEHDFFLDVERAERYAETKHWPKNDSACNHYGGCPFKLPCMRTGHEEEPTQFPDCELPSDYLPHIL